MKADFHPIFRLTKTKKFLKKLEKEINLIILEETPFLRLLPPLQIIQITEQIPFQHQRLGHFQNVSEIELFFLSLDQCTSKYHWAKFLSFLFRIASLLFSFVLNRDFDLKFAYLPTLCLKIKVKIDVNQNLKDFAVLPLYQGQRLLKYLG